MIVSRPLASAAVVLGFACAVSAQSPLIVSPRLSVQSALQAQAIDVPESLPVPALVPPTTEALPQPTPLPQPNAAPPVPGSFNPYGDPANSGMSSAAPGVYVDGFAVPGSIRPAPLNPITDDGYHRNAGAHLAVPPPLGLIAPQAYAGGLHERYPYYSYRRPWYPAGPASLNVTIVW